MVLAQNRSIAVTLEVIHLTKSHTARLVVWVGPYDHLIFVIFPLKEKIKYQIKILRLTCMGPRIIILIIFLRSLSLFFISPKFIENDVEGIRKIVVQSG